MDHFFFLDAKKALQEEEEAELLKRMHDDDFDFSALSEKEQVVFTRLSTKSPSTLLDSDQNFNILGAEEYLTDLKDMFEAIKRPPIPHKWKGKKDRKNWKKKVREYEENYQVVQVAPSIIPAYYSAIRVFEYNVSELAGTQFRRGNQQPIIRTNWTEWWSQMDRQIEDERLQEHDDLTIQNVDVGDGDIYPLPDNLDSPSRRRRNRKSRHGPIKKKTKKHPPSLHIPDGPHKSAPRGPIYDSQLFTPLRWEVHFVNLTEMNAKYENNPSKSWDYGKDFFKMEYTSDAAPYNLKDLTVGAWLDLGRKIGKEKEIKKKTDLDPGDMEEFVDYSGEGLHAFKDDYLDDGEEEFDLSDDNRDTDVSDGEDDDVAVAKKGKKGKGKKGKKEKGSGETFWDIFLRRAFVNSGHEYQLDFD
jgi:endopolyphosphatase